MKEEISQVAIGRSIGVLVLKGLINEIEVFFFFHITLCSSVTLFSFIYMQVLSIYICNESHNSLQNIFVGAQGETGKIMLKSLFIQIFIIFPL